MLGALVRGMVGLALLAFGASAYTMIGAVHTLTCDRASGTCTLERGTERPSTVRIKLEGLTGAKVEDIREVHPERASRNSAGSARLVLLTKNGPVPFMEYYSGIRMDEMAVHKAAVEVFLGPNGPPGLRIQRDDRLLAAMVAVAPLLIGTGCLVSAVRQYRRWWNE
jgi:hypothetical protein